MKINFNKNSIKLNENKLINEEKAVYTVEFLIKAQPKTRIYGKIFEAIRGIEGVTVIRATKAEKNDPQGNKVMQLYVRFYVESGFSIQYVEALKHKINGMKDAEGDSILSVKVVQYPQKQDSYNK